MNLKKQVDKIKENWLILLLVVVLIIVLNGNFFGNGLNLGFEKNLATIGIVQERGFYGGSDFAPEVEDRIKTISTSISTEIKRGEFAGAEDELKIIIENYNAFLLNENVRKSEDGFMETNYGSYTIKVDVLKYEEIINDLKEIGEVQSFNENTEDVTGQYTDLKLNLELEKERLIRYKEMYGDAKEISDKIELNDRIFNQERTIKYLEDRIENLDKKVDYATVYFSMNEKRSGYANLALIKLSELVKAFVGSVNNLFQLLFVVIPWIIFGGIVFWIYRFFRKK